jgi:hypothetical protein
LSELSSSDDDEVVIRRKAKTTKGRASSTRKPITPVASRARASAATAKPSTPISASKKGSDSQDSALKKKRNPFTAEEDEAIRRGVAKYGEGKWREILDDPEFQSIFEEYERTNTGLKDRWRNLNK